MSVGYPMTYRRVVLRSHLEGGYLNFVDGKCEPPPPGLTEREYNFMRLIAGDLRRLEKNQRDPKHLLEYAKRAGVTAAQAEAVLDAFFEGDF